MNEKDEKIKELEATVVLLEQANANKDQYSRRYIFRIEGILKTVYTGQIEKSVLDIVNARMKMN